MSSKPTPATPALDEPHSKKQLLWLIAVLVFVCMNLRPMLTGLGPVLDSVRQSLQLSNTAVGLLITLPVLCFGLIAPIAPKLLPYFSAERLVTLGMIIQVIGIALRSLFGAPGLFIGTLVGGIGIGIVMVVLPGLIKQHFPTKASLMMGVYSTALCLGATISAALAVPLEELPGSSWRWSLAFWLVPATVSIVAWWRINRNTPQTAASVRSASALPKLSRNWLAWHITLYMGTQSTIAYCVFGWLPVILIDRGLSPLNAGFALSLLMLVQIVTSLTAPWMAQHGRDQRGVIAGLSILMWVGILGLFFAPIGQVWLHATVAGLGLGGIFAMSLAFLVLRSPNAQVAAALSGMAQGVGYTIAATGPFLVGWLHEVTDSWNSVAIFFMVLMSVATCFGLSAGRNLTIKLPEPRKS
ncbi:MFS transporter [Pusillimonas sp. CC-YST705]|uniref:MFS transporter n=1 Tax=Mesopusillimonas faecipullorum TaxID=2755040 RepID=A0ABS8CC88_9BURK|nr:MFS transporter [Mesopusillimonas faecipullorum]MCB5363650.1 MFS transporter [Mesopusillimonas faecipullorum]